MKITSTHKKRGIVLISTLLVAYLFANWRLDANLSRIQASFQKEEALHLSTDKLVINCEKNAAANENAFDANHRICDQGHQVHEQTEQQMQRLDLEKQKHQANWYRNFVLAFIVLNLLGLIFYKAKNFLKRELA